MNTSEDQEYVPPLPTKEDEENQEREQLIENHLIILFDVDAVILLKPFHLTLFRRIPYKEIKSYFVTKVVDWLYLCISNLPL